MAVDNSLEALLGTLTTSIQSATSVLPTEEEIVPPKAGISILDLKNELLLSYIQNLVFLILLKLRSRKSVIEGEDESPHEPVEQSDVVQKLVELRVYLEKGVRPLENRLKYNIDKILRTADSALQRKESSRGQRAFAAHGTSPSDAHDGEAKDPAKTDDEEDEMSYAPRRGAIVRPASIKAATPTEDAGNDGVYRPPRITPVSMPTSDRPEKRERHPGKSATIDEFIATELTSAPLAEPSIGSMIVNGGRYTKSERDRREEAERRDYEEANLTRLAPPSKKEKAKTRARQRNGAFGGEDWRLLGQGIDRIEKLTQRREGRPGVLDKSRKRAVTDGPRDSGAMGDAFEKRRKVVGRYRK